MKIEYSEGTECGLSELECGDMFEFSKNEINTNKDLDYGVCMLVSGDTGAVFGADVVSFETGRHIMCEKGVGVYRKNVSLRVSNIQQNCLEDISESLVMARDDISCIVKYEDLAAGDIFTYNNGTDAPVYLKLDGNVDSLNLKTHKIVKALLDKYTSVFKMDAVMKVGAYIG